MTELALSVRLNADGSGLVGQVRLSKAAVDELKGATEALGRSATAASPAVATMGAAAASAGGAAEALGGDLRQAGAAAEGLATATRQAQGAVNQLGAANARARQAVNDNVTSLRAQQFAVRNVGQQIGDFGLQVASGQDPARAFSQQIGQLGYAMSELGGAAGKVGAFLTGPWGIAITVGAAVLAPFVAELFSAKKATEELTLVGDSLADAQAVLGKAFDLTTGKLKDNTAALLLNARAKELNLRAGAAEKESNAIGIFGRGSERAGVREATNLAVLTAAIGAGPADLLADGLGLRGNRDVQALARRAELARRGTRDAASPKERQAAYAELNSLLLESQNTDFKGAPITKKEFQDSLLAIADARSANAVANLINKSLADGELAPGLRREAKGRKPRKAASTAEFGEDTAARLAGLQDRYSALPAAVRDANTQLRQLDDIASDLERKKPPNYAALKEQIEATRAAVAGGRDKGLAEEIDKIGAAFGGVGEGSERARAATEQLDAIVGYLNQNLARNPGFAGLIEQAGEARAQIERGVLKPYQDVIENQRDQLRIGALIAAGRQDEAQALQITLGLERQRVPLTDQQRANILLGVRAAREQNAELEKATRRQQNLVNAVRDVRGSLTGALAGESDNLLGDLVQTFRRAFAEQLSQRLIDPVVNSIIGSITREDTIKGAGDAFKSAVLATQQPLADLAKNARAASDALGKTGLSTDGGGTAGSVPGQDQGVDVVVTGRRPSQGDPQSVEGLLSKIIGDGLKIAGVSSKAADALGGLFKNALGGAGTGLAVAGLAQSLGLKLSNTGSAVGGAAGQALGFAIGGPAGGQIGSLIGSGIGGIIGNLFKPTPKAKGGAITSVDGKIDVTGTNAQAKDAVAQASRAVQSGIQQIAEQLGAEIGAFSVSIAKYKDSFRVDPTGSGSDGGKYGNKYVAGIGKFDNNDSAGAIAFAIADAIKDGAIKGISPAVAKALQSSTDINKALKEALKVQDLEELLGGVNYSIRKSFDEFDRTAAERVELAKKYGFDLLQVEKVNAEARAKLVNDTLQSRVEDLKSFLNSVRYGDLFEGSAADRRKQILAEIATAEADAVAGVEGAASRLADLQRTLVQTSRDAYGTAGPEYGADRSSAIASAERIIKIEQERIDTAAGLQKATTDAIMAGNSLTDETNNLIAITNGKLDTLIAQLPGGVTAGGGDYGNWLSTPDLGLTIRNFA